VHGLRPHRYLKPTPAPSEKEGEGRGKGSMHDFSLFSLWFQK
jgi:hypothetical protein